MVAAVLPPHVMQELEAAYGAAIRPAAKTNTPGLAALFGVADPRQFLTQRGSDQFCIARGGLERLAGLCDFELDQLIPMKRSFAKAFRVIDGKHHSLKIEPGQERALYEAGFTIYFHSLRTPTMDAWISAITDELGLVPGATRVSAFASKRGHGLKAHYDQNDNFVCQARGSKRWRIAPNTHVMNPTVGYTVGEKPTPANMAEAPNGFPSALPTPFAVVDLTPGTVMFMPSGMWHDTETTDDASLHFNIQTGVATWKDVVEYVLMEGSLLNGIEGIRARLSTVATRAELDAQFKEELKAKLAVVCERLLAGEIDVHRDGLFRYVAKRRSAI
jgi:ribosomal protein L16 Arg81 hydroxylase